VKLFRRFLLFLNLILIFSLLGAYASAFVSPSTFWPFAFLGLAYPYLAFLNLVFMVVWIFVRWQFAFLSGLALITGYYFAAGTYQLNPPQGDEKQANDFKVMSFNVRLFDLYNWSKNKETRKEIIQLIQQENPDIIAFQEYYSNNDGYHVHTDSIKEWLGLKFAHTYFTYSLHKKQNWGIATFSRYPIINKDRVSLDNSRNNTCIFSDIVVPGNDTFRVYNMHLQSIHLQKEDYKFMEDIQNDTTEVDELKGSENILRKLKRAFVKRAIQCDSIASSIRQSKHPVVVCGDFNDTPVSYTYQTLSEGLKDGFKESGRGFGKTYNGLLPSMRIDYILHSDVLEGQNFRVIYKKLSDHFPVVCRLKSRTKEIVP
jgi:endonuclease/exonuclease/phosphatase family metal-dependent hydrolase